MLERQKVFEFVEQFDRPAGRFLSSIKYFRYLVNEFFGVVAAEQTGRMTEGVTMIHEERVDRRAIMGRFGSRELMGKGNIHLGSPTGPGLFPGSSLPSWQHDHSVAVSQRRPRPNDRAAFSFFCFVGVVSRLRILHEL